MAMSTTTLPGRIEAIISRLTSLGAFAPGTSTAPITTSASATYAAVRARLGVIRSSRPPKMSER